MDKQTQLTTLISEAITKRKEYELTLSRIGRIIGTDTNGAELVLKVTNFGTFSNVLKSTTDMIQPIVQYLSSRKGQAVPLKEMYEALGQDCSYGAFSSRVNNAVSKRLITQLSRGFYSISPHAEVKDSNNKKEIIESLNDGAAKVYKLVTKYPDISVATISGKIKISKSVVHYHLKNLSKKKLVKSTGRGSYAAL